MRTDVRLLKQCIPPQRIALGFLCSLVMVLCVGIAGAQEKPPATANEDLKIRHYNVLGRTGLRVSDLGFGTAGSADPALIEYALDLGINFFDTAEQYAGGQSETAIGLVAKERRDEMVICTKLVMDGSTTQEEIFTRVDACLERLQSDYVDILMIHGGPSSAVENPEIYAAFDRLKEQGKIRFTGISHHGPNIAAELTPVVAADKLDVILCSYDPVGDPEIPTMLEQARQKGIGLVAMKVFASARAAELPEFVSGDYPFHLAALRWALKGGVDTAISSLIMMDQIDEYVQASGAGREQRQP